MQKVQNLAKILYEGLDALCYFAEQGIPLIGAYASGAMIAEQKPENFSSDPAEIAGLAAGRGDRLGRAQGSKIRRFYFIPKDAGLLCLDIDRKPGKRDGLAELYKLFPPAILPRALQDIPAAFPCYVSTPSGGYHLYFKYAGELIRKADLCPEVEIKHGRPGLTAPGSCKENGAYILYGNIADAPPLYGIILDRIETLRTEKKTVILHTQGREKLFQARSEHPRTPKQRIDLSVLAGEACAAYAGHHDRQVSFAWRARRCRFTVSDTLEYVKANASIFGNGADTENTIHSVFKEGIG